MSCCGSARSRSTNFPSAQQMRASVVFEYTGKTALNIVGPGSRTAYRFDLGGAHVLVELGLALEELEDAGGRAIRLPDRPGEAE